MYLALARKYRPQKFSDLIGQPHITRTLQNAISMDKLYPALIFSGTKGVGKTSAARILSKALNCEKGPDIEPCNECEICREITGDNSPDYIEIDGASNNGVEEVRTLKEKVKYKPFRNRFRVVVIDEVHMLSTSAWNALLKTIEEPPEHTYFIMATTDFHKIPATIVSRCQQFEFKRIPYEVIIKLLREIVDRENVKITDYSLYLVAKASEGSLRDAKKVLDQAIAISSSDVQDKDVLDILGVIEEEIFIELTRAVFTRDRGAIISKINDLSERGMDLRFFYNEYLKFFRDLLILKSLEESAERLHNLNPENIPALREMLKNVRDIELLRYFNAAKDLEMTIKNTENPRIILEYLFIKLSYFSSLVSIEDLIDAAKSGKLGHVEIAAPAPPPQAAPPVSHRAPAPSAPVTGPPPAPGPPPGAYAQAPGPGPAGPVPQAPPPGNVPADFKARFVETVGRDKPRWSSALGQSSIEVRGNTVHICFPGEFDFAYKNASGQIDYLVDRASRILNFPAQIQLSLDEAAKQAEEARIKELGGDEKINRLARKMQGKVVTVEKIQK